ncbi:hypothetical protein D3C81_1596330 [compost metagenome]
MPFGQLNGQICTCCSEMQLAVFPLIQDVAALLQAAQMAAPGFYRVLLIGADCLEDCIPEQINLRFRCSIRKHFCRPGS